MSAEQHDVMTAAEVADYLQISVRSVHDYAARDELPSVRIGRHRRFSRMPRAGLEPAPPD